MNTTPKDAPNIFGRFCLLGANMEQWRDVPGYEGLYRVSDQGRVRSLDRISTVPPNKRQRDGFTRTIRGQELATYSNADGYKVVTLAKDRKKQTKQVHRLVAEAFIPNPDGKPCVNHRDGCKTNNTPSNLEWVTIRENVGHAYATGLRSAQFGKPPTFYEYTKTQK